MIIMDHLPSSFSNVIVGLPADLECTFLHKEKNIYQAYLKKCWFTVM